MIHKLRYALMLCLVTFGGVSCSQVGGQTVKPLTELDSKDAWIGEPVTLSITLFSPGPFSGTANFELPELEAAVIIRKGNPVLGNKVVDGNSLLTQRHNFLVLSQKSGRLQIPSFKVSYAGKPDFLSDPVPLEVVTESVFVDVQRPVGFSDKQMVVAATKVSAEQSWHDLGEQAIQVGGIVQRTIKQTINGSTSLFLLDVVQPEIEGVSLYRSSPQVEDTFARGALSGERVDVLKYQFTETGRYELPEVEIRWWNLKDEAIETETLPGKSIEVEALLGVEEEEKVGDANRPAYWWIVLLALTCAAVLGCLFTWATPLAKTLSRKESLADRVIKACKKNDALRTYEAYLAWQRGCDRIVPDDGEMQMQWSALSRHLFGGDGPLNAWEGEPFLVAFRSQISVKPEDRVKNDLGPLNPA